jgi:multidrug efflux pump subunit AcrB
VNVSQQVGANILEVRDGVESTLRELTASLPSGLRISKVYDLAGFVSDAMGSVRDAIVIGGLLAVVVLFVFLRSWRITLVAALTLPLTIVSTFLFMRFFGETVNLMSMGGLAVAIGLVIDDAVVVWRTSTATSLAARRTRSRRRRRSWWRPSSGPPSPPSSCSRRWAFSPAWSASSSAPSPSP